MTDWFEDDIDYTDTAPKRTCNKWFKAADGLYYKICSKCKVCKESSNFTVANGVRGPVKRKPTCRICAAAYHKARTLQRTNYSREWRWKNADKITKERRIRQRVASRCVIFAREMGVYETFVTEVEQEMINEL